MDENLISQSAESEEIRLNNKDNIPVFTEEQTRYMQSEIDRRVTAAHVKWDSKMKEDMKETEEAVRNEEREKSEKEKSEISDRLNKAESAYRSLQNKFRCAAEMEKRGIPVAFVDMIACEDTEETDVRLQTFTELFRSALKEEISKKLSSPTPKNGIQSPSITKKDFREMNLSEHQFLKNSDPDLYNELVKNI